tara:strand:+ start:223 stop:381 length:159 start_codon:yes stop_codon:yes gene_type:complete
MKLNNLSPREKLLLLSFRRAKREKDLKARLGKAEKYNEGCKLLAKAKLNYAK